MFTSQCIANMLMSYLAVIVLFIVGLSTFSPTSWKTWQRSHLWIERKWFALENYRKWMYCEHVFSRTRYVRGFNLPWPFCSEMQTDITSLLFWHGSINDEIIRQLCKCSKDFIKRKGFHLIWFLDSMIGYRLVVSCSASVSESAGLCFSVILSVNTFKFFD